MEIENYLLLFSAISFYFFGVACLYAPKMKSEFIRYGLKKQRVLTGFLQLAGATGLLLGFWCSTVLVILAAGGLSLLMFLGFIVRLRIKDAFFQAFPSLFYALLNLYIALSYIL